jgi:amidophosphoribosyltransferase
MTRDAASPFKEKCALFGVFGEGMAASRLTYFGLFALQHRGQESSGIAASDGKTIKIHRNLGLVAQVYNEEDLQKLPGHLAIGHNRYSTSGGSFSEHTQPIGTKNDIVTLAHNGNLPTTEKLEKFLIRKGIATNGLNDSGLMQTLIKYYLVKGFTLEKAIAKSYPLFTGAFCILVMTKDKIAAVRDPYGIRPFSLGKLNGGYIFSSETCALDTVNAEHIRDIKPGEMVVVDNEGLHSYTLAQAKPKLDIFEFVYFSRPDSTLLGKRVYDVRKNLGRQLAKEFKVKADVVIPVPDSAIPAALGFSHQSGIPFEYGLVKNRYIGRTFIMPDQKLRDRGVQMKLNPIEEVIKGKRVVVIDDSIVRGTTARKLVTMIRDAGAK